MATITEDYVSFEIAKLLKEKGFNIPCNCYGAYNGVNLTYGLCITDKYTNWNKHTDKFIISCPTLQMAMKWLRETHELYIEVSLSCDREDKNAKIFDASIFNIQNQRYKKLSNIQGYEQAGDAAIKYCVENLILN